MDDHQPSNLLRVSLARALLEAATAGSSTPVLSTDLGVHSPCHAATTSISASDSTSESSSGQSSNIGTSSSQQLTANGLNLGNSKSTISSLSKNSSSMGDKHAAASALGSVRNLDTSREPTQKGISMQAGTENSQAYIESMLARYTGRCSSGCRCASDARFLLRLFQKCEKLRGVGDRQAYSAARTVLLRALPRFAAAMLYLLHATGWWPCMISCWCSQSEWAWLIKLIKVCRGSCMCNAWTHLVNAITDSCSAVCTTHGLQPIVNVFSSWHTVHSFCPC